MKKRNRILFLILAVFCAVAGFFLVIYNYTTLGLILTALWGYLINKVIYNNK